MIWHISTDKTLVTLSRNHSAELTNDSSTTNGVTAQFDTDTVKRLLRTNRDGCLNIRSRNISDGSTQLFSVVHGMCKPEWHQ